MPIPSSVPGLSGYGPSPTHSHLNGHADSTSSKHSSYDASKKRLQPIGADNKTRTNEKAINGLSKRSSLVIESGSKEKPKEPPLKQPEGKKMSSSSSLLPPSADQASSKAMATTESVAESSRVPGSGGIVTVHSKLLPRLV